MYAKGVVGGEGGRLESGADFHGRRRVGLIIPSLLPAGTSQRHRGCLCRYNTRCNRRVQFA